MKINKKYLNLEDGIKREWIITNGIGGYSSSTIIGANTRRYHGLLVAPLTPPAKRNLILSKIDESIEIEGKQYNLYTNICRDFISDGYKYLEEFEKDYMPIFKYKIGETTIKKIICMQYGKNTVCILYKIENNGPKLKLNLTPIINFRDFHSLTTDHSFTLQQSIRGRKLKIEVDNNSSNPIYIYSSKGKYIEHTNDTFYNMHYVEEEKRGFYPEENLAVSGTFEIEVPKESTKEISIICSLEDNIEEIDVKKVINKEIIRINEILNETDLIDVKKDIKKIPSEERKEMELTRDFIIALDNFVVYRPSFMLYTTIAGYPWFLDWGRDSLISFEGILLKTKRYNTARDILLTLVRDIKFGLIPNGYSGYDNRPLYNSADSSLLLFEQVYKYLKYTNDAEFIENNIYNKLLVIIENYKKGIDLDNNNIYLDEDGLISSGTKETQNTWMDAKYGVVAFTPRNGKAVEINSLWYNALKIMEELSTKFKKRKDAKEYAKMAEECKSSFKAKFYNKRKKCLYDVLGDSKLRPNQLFAISLSHSVIEPDSDMAKDILKSVQNKLLNKYGLKTLAKGEEGYIDVYEGDNFRRDASYHQGITWPWLLGIYFDALNNIIKSEKKKEIKKEYQEELDNFKKQTKRVFEKELYERGAIGSISEIYDSKSPYEAKGTIAQAWSVAEIFRIIYS